MHLCTPLPQLQMSIKKIYYEENHTHIKYKQLTIIINKIRKECMNCTNSNLRTIFILKMKNKF